MKSQKRIPFSFIIVTLFALFALVSPSFAQFGTPTIDATIGASEYGVHIDSGNQQLSGAQTAYMTWDDTNLYIAFDAANTAEGAVVYIDANPIAPINGGDNSNGTVVGQNYDGTSFAHLPFRADFVTYFKNGYREYRTADGAGGWSAQTSGFGAYADDADTRELAIPWSAITGAGRPASFAWFGYITSAGGFVFGEVPTQNGDGAIGATATYNHYYNIENTNTGTSTYPFFKLGYAQNFDSLANDSVGNPYTWTNNSTIQNWYSSRIAYTVNNGSSNAGALYSYGTGTFSERALGSVASGGTGTVLSGYRFTNTNAQAIQSFTITYVGEQWRNGGNTTPQQLDFSYQVNATDLTSGTWIDLNSLDFVGPIATATAGTLDGNLPANRVLLTAIISIPGPAFLPVNDTITFRFSDINDAGNDHGLSVDNFTVVANPAFTPTAVTLSQTGAQTAALPTLPFALAFLMLALASLAIGRRQQA